MAAKRTAAASPGDAGIILTRLLDAPRDLAFRAWTEPGHLTHWWGPKGFTTPICEVDLRPGGTFHYCMRSPEGRDYCGVGTYREIVEPERIVYLDSFADTVGNPVSPSYYGMSDSHPSESLVTVTFADEGGKTRLTVRHAVAPSVEEREMMQQGWGEMLDRLSAAIG